jgi:hypothetical protein
MKYGTVEVQDHAFLTSVLDGESGRLHAPGKSPPVPMDRKLSEPETVLDAVAGGHWLKFRPGLVRPCV